MSDKGIKNVVVKKDSLGKVTSSNSRLVRFRIVAEDKNRKSAHSKIFIVGSDAILVGDGALSPLGNTLLLTWSTSNTSSEISYDIFIGFDGAAPAYVDSTKTKNYSFLKTGTQSVRAVVQISSIKPSLAEALEVYDSGIVTLPIPTP
jgi:hypothetical protein